MPLVECKGPSSEMVQDLLAIEALSDSASCRMQGSLIRDGAGPTRDRGPVRLCLLSNVRVLYQRRCRTDSRLRPCPTVPLVECKSPSSETVQDLLAIEYLSDCASCQMQGSFIRDGAGPTRDRGPVRLCLLSKARVLDQRRCRTYSRSRPCPTVPLVECKSPSSETVQDILAIEALSDCAS